MESKHEMSQKEIRIKLNKLKSECGFYLDKDFAKYVKMQSSGYSAVKRGDRDATENFLNKLVVNAGLNLEWWYTGKGKIIVDNVSKRSNFSSKADTSSNNEYPERSDELIRMLKDMRDKLEYLNQMNEVNKNLSKSNSDLIDLLRTLQS